MYSIKVIEDNFKEQNYILDEIREINPSGRILYYFNNFTSYKDLFHPGSASDDSIIISYDSLLMSKDNYEKLIYLSMIHLGDSDTTGIISSNWYGAYYGFKNVYKHLYKEDENYNDIKIRTKKLFKKYYK